MADFSIYASDAGSVSKGNFHWVGTHDMGADSDDISQLADAIIADLKSGRRVALGLECVLFIPCPQDELRLGMARIGECTRETGNKPFTASAGACATMSGMPALGWLLRRIKQEFPKVTATTRWGEFKSGKAKLFIWEAFVSGYEKGESHGEDARLAIEGFRASMNSMGDATRVTGEGPFSLAGSLILWSGLSTDASLLTEPVVVIRPIIAPETIEARIAHKKRIAAEKRRRKRESAAVR